MYSRNAGSTRKNVLDKFTLVCFHKSFLTALMEIKYKSKRNHQYIEIEYDPIKINQKIITFTKRIIYFILLFHLSHRILQQAYNFY